MAPCLLVVDDEPDILRTLELLFRTGRPNLAVRTVPSAAEALAVLGSTTIDLLITDYRMPKMDGLRLVRQVRKGWPDCQSILLTAYPDLDVAVEALNSGHIRQFLVKPADPDRLLAVVDELVGAQQSARQRLAALERAGKGGEKPSPP